MDSIAEHALYARFLRGLRAFPRRPALRVGTRTVSYEEAHETALRWSGAALAAAARPPRAVGVLTGRSTDAYLAVLAALYTGAAVVPLHAEFPVERTREMLRAAGVSVVLADEQGLATLAATGLDLPAVPAAAARGPAGRAAGLDAPRPVAPDDTAYVLFTSGSTGRPKGVPITHANTAHYFGLMDHRYDFTETDVFSQTFDLNFDCAMFDLFCAWGAGARVQAIPPLAYRDLPDFFTECGMTVWFSTPSVVALSRRLSGLVADSMPTLRWSLFAGEALRQADAEEWQRAASRSTLENIYGPTELTITIAGHRWDPERSPARCVNGLVPIGAVHAGHDHLLLGSDGGVDPTEGELCVSGPQTTPATSIRGTARGGSWNAPEPSGTAPATGYGGWPAANWRTSAGWTPRCRCRAGGWSWPRWRPRRAPATAWRTRSWCRGAPRTAPNWSFSTPECPPRRPRWRAGCGRCCRRGCCPGSTTTWRSSRSTPTGRSTAGTWRVRPYARSDAPRGPGRQAPTGPLTGPPTPSPTSPARPMFASGGPGALLCLLLSGPAPPRTARPAPPCRPCRWR